MHLFIPILAADYTAERRREADHRRLEALVSRAAEPGISPVRWLAARVLVAISRASASAVRRLDACLADDLGLALGSTDGA